MPVFGGLDADSIGLLLERAREVSVPTGEHFFREGDNGQSAFVLEHGRVAIVKSRDGENCFVRHLETGDIFGEVALMDFFPRSASVVATEDCRALELGAGDLLELANKDLEHFSLVYMNIARELARRLRTADDLLFQARIRHADIAEDYAFRST